MKRSEVNAAIRWTEELLRKNNISLPDMAYYAPEKWLEVKDDARVVFRTMMGWDITDFGVGDYDKIGAVLYTVRNGLVTNSDVGVPYCEKYIVMKEGQRLPKHYHVFKTEDIINRAGGRLSVYLWNTDDAGNQLETDVYVYMDGIRRKFKAGEKITVLPGKQHIAHSPYSAYIRP